MHSSVSSAFCTVKPRNLRRMSELHERLKKARLSAGIETAAAAVERFGGQYFQHENGTRGFRAATGEKYARAFRVSFDWLMNGKGEMLGSANSVQRGIPIVGKAAAGPDGSYVFPFAEGAHDVLEPFDPDSTIVTIVEGTSMVPRFMPGEKVVWGRVAQDPTPFVNKQVLAQLKEDGQMIKILRRSQSKGRWDLHSLNPAFDPIEGVELEWVRPFEGLRA